MRLIEGYPADVVAALLKRDSALLNAAVEKPDWSHDEAIRSVITLSRRWRPAQVVTVAFKGGSPAVRDSIVRIANLWTQFANLSFDFWTDNGRRTYREWSQSDGSYQAHVRIGFDRPGYWSFVGKESIDDDVARPNKASMNFESFDRKLPSDWDAVVLHEFGHALALQHEHQNPLSACETEFRFDDDPGYIQSRDRYGQFVADVRGRRPGIYTVLGGPPNRWDSSVVDFNLRRLAYTADLEAETFDPVSIMKYYFDSWMFRSGTSSKCYSAPAFSMSAGDRAVAQRNYPASVASVPSREQAARDALQSISLTPQTRLDLGRELRKMAAKQAAASANISR